MVNRFDETGCWVNDGEFVNYTDYRELEVRHDVFLKGVRAALTELENSPEVNERSRAEEVIDINAAVDETIKLLMAALDKGRD
jgi:hypothetical protein